MGGSLWCWSGDSWALGGCGGWKAGYGGVAGPLRCEEWRL